MLNNITTAAAFCASMLTMPAFADTGEVAPRCQVYSTDIGMGLERAGLPALTTCLSEPTKNEAEFEFSLTLTDGSIAKMTCDPIGCSAPRIAKK
jgi:hypothetical protein